MRLLPSFLLLASVFPVRCAQITIPDVCEGPVCLRNLIWKKGFTAHTLSGIVTTQRNIESLNITLSFSDSKRKGSTELHLFDVAKPTNFFFKVSNMPADGIKWEQSSLTLNAVAIHAIAPAEQDGLSCTFASLGSRLKTNIRSQVKTDLILDYSMLMITAADTNLKLNGATGRYIELDKPRPNSLIPEGSTHTEVHSDECAPVSGRRLDRVVDSPGRIGVERTEADPAVDCGGQAAVGENPAPGGSDETFGYRLAPGKKIGHTISDGSCESCAKIHAGLLRHAPRRPTARARHFPPAIPTRCARAPR
jgi:hypothetical protein